MSGFSKEHDPVGVRSFAVVVYTPAGGRFRELLRIDQHKKRVKSRVKTARNDVLLQSNTATPNLTYLERHVPAGPQDPSQLREHRRHRFPPIMNLLWNSQLYISRAETTEPTTQPVVPRVIDDIEEWRRRGPPGKERWLTV